MHFGIDLGTTNSLIAVLRDGAPTLIPNALGEVLTPSVVALINGQLAVGQTARSVALSNPGRAAALFKRAMGTERTCRLGGTVHDGVIWLPAYFNELQRKVVRKAGRTAGLNVPRLINAPTAAALA